MHVDLHNVFGKPMVQTTIFKNAYRTLRLNEVSKAVLGDIIEGVGGKYKGLTGKDIQTLPNEQKKYVLRDEGSRYSTNNNYFVVPAAQILNFFFIYVLNTLSLLLLIQLQPF